METDLCSCTRPYSPSDIGKPCASMICHMMIVHRPRQRLFLAILCDDDLGVLNGNDISDKPVWKRKILGVVICFCCWWWCKYGACCCLCLEGVAYKEWSWFVRGAVGGGVGEAKSTAYFDTDIVGALRAARREGGIVAESNTGYLVDVFGVMFFQYRGGGGSGGKTEWTAAFLANFNYLIIIITNYY